jgi:hypothetical protein
MVIAKTEADASAVAVTLSDFKAFNAGNAAITDFKHGTFIHK